jgi:hypothetical protein
MQVINNDYEPLLQASSSYNDDSHMFGITSLARRQRLLVAYRHTKWHLLVVCLTYIVTSTLYPTFLSKIQPASPSNNYPHSVWTNQLYSQVMTFLLFNLGDMCGRIISSKVHLPSLNCPRILFIISLVRCIFLVLFGFCHISSTNNFPYLFQHDSIYAILILAFAVSHGYCQTLSMMYAPSCVHMQLRSTVGALMLLVSILFIHINILNHESFLIDE